MERRANIQGGGGDSGKCTIEVEVDGTATLEIRGDRAWLRTNQGERATWRRFDCNGILPRNPSDFRFRGIDGRGRQDLVRDPRSNGGTAVVRIQDTAGGREGYTFDIEWRGFGGDGGYPPPGPGGPGGGWGWSGYWDNGWGDEIRYQGVGQGEFYAEGGQHYRIRRVEVIVQRRDGSVVVNLDASNSPDTLRFRGRIQRAQRGMVHADLRLASNWGRVNNADGIMNIALNNGRVNELNMDGRSGPRRFTVRWRD